MKGGETYDGYGGIEQKRYAKAEKHRYPFTAALRHRG
jgi:hypothetical protein